MAKKILLLNPPGKFLYFREYYCSKVSKGYYYYPPVDFIYLSGRLAGYEVTYLDCIARGLNPAQAFNWIRTYAPDVIISLVSSPSYAEDMEFLAQAGRVVELIVTGDLARGMGAQLLKDHPFIRAAFTDFSTDGIIQYLSGPRQRTIENVIYRDGEAIIAGPETHATGVWETPLPRQDLFLLPRYAMPFSRRRNLAVVLSDFGCAYGCTYCPLGTIPMRLRPLPDMEAEFKLLRSLGVGELFLQDQTFGVKKDRSLQLLEMMRPFGFSFCCHSRLDVVDRELLAALKRAGCHTILFGAETANEPLLNQEYHKGIHVDLLEQIRLIKQSGINTCASFILGLPGETKESITKTIEFARRAALDYASFNLAAPRMGTKLREKALAQGWLDAGQVVVESARSEPVWRGLELSNREIAGLHRLAVRKFFLRPFFLIKQLFLLRSFFEGLNKAREWRRLIAVTLFRRP